MATYRYGHDPNRPDKPLPENGSADALVKRIADDVEKSFRPRHGNHKVKVFAGLAEEKPDGTRNELLLHVEFPSDSKGVDEFCKAALICGGIYFIARLIDGR